MELESFFKRIREEAGPALWSKGVELARLDAVTGDGEQGGELKLRVLNKSGGVSPIVTLAIGDGDWHCSCGGDDDPCAHVVAAVIALKRAREAGKELPRSALGSGKVIYRLRRSAQGLEFERYIKDAQTETLLTTALTALTSGRVKGPAVSATAGDMQVESALASDRRGALPAARWPALIKALAVDGLDVQLDGKSIGLNPNPVGLAALAVDDGPGVRVKIQQDEAISELFANGVALCGAELRPVVLPGLTPAQRELVRDGRFFPRSELASVASDLLPALLQLMPVASRARNLPTTETAAWAHIQLDLQVLPAVDGLTVEAQLHYGQPSVGRLKSGQWILSGDRVPRRDPGEESRLQDELRRRLQLEVDQLVQLNSADAVRFVQRLAAYPLPTTGNGKTYFTVYPELSPHLSQAQGGSVGFHAAQAGGEAKNADPARVLQAWRRGDVLVPLLGGGMAPLPTTWLATHGERLLAFLAARGDGTKPLPVAALPLLAEVSESFGQSLPDGLSQLCRKLQQATLSSPQGARSKLHLATLRGYQEEGVHWLSALQDLGVGALLADDMGLGKTLQALAVMPPSGQGRTLVVAPTSVLFNWRAEADKFRPDLKRCVYHGPTRQLDPQADVVLTTYAVLRLDQDLLADQTWDMLVLDEAQNLKNPDSLATLAAARINAAFRVGLSGTPVENRLEDLWSLMHLLNRGLLGDRRFFQEHYAKPIMDGDAQRASALRRRIKPCFLRRLKQDVAADLPARTETVLYAELSPSERARYDMVLAATRQEVLDKLAAGGSVLAALEALLRLRQAACHPDLLPGVHGEASAKLALLIATLQASGENGHKTLVFSQWTSFLDLMQPALEEASITYLRLDGSTADRGAIVSAFQQPDGPQVLIMSLKAGGVGLNLTAADHVIIADPWWNPAAEDQAADRAHRIGQERPVLIQRLVALGTVEERILALQEAKRGLARAAVDDAGAGFSALSRDDLVALLS